MRKSRKNGGKVFSDHENQTKDDIPSLKLTSIDIGKWMIFEDFLVSLLG